MKILGLIAAAALLAGAQSAYAVTINNGSFESGPAVPSNGYQQVPDGVGVPANAISGWTVGGAGVDYIGGTTPYWTASNGSASIDLNANDSGSISQLITGLSAGQQYTIRFDLSGNPDSKSVKGVGVFTDGAWDASSSDHLYTFDTNAANNTKTAMGWSPQVYTFIASATEQTLTFLSTTGTGWGAAIDNVTIAATPIPGAILLFGSALGGMGFLGYRRKKLEAAA